MKRTLTGAVGDSSAAPKCLTRLLIAATFFRAASPERIVMAAPFARGKVGMGGDGVLGRRVERRARVKCLPYERAAPPFDLNVRRDEVFLPLDFHRTTMQYLRQVVVGSVDARRESPKRHRKVWCQIPTFRYASPRRCVAVCPRACSTA